MRLNSIVIILLFVVVFIITVQNNYSVGYSDAIIVNISQYDPYGELGHIIRYKVTVAYPSTTTGWWRIPLPYSLSISDIANAFLVTSTGNTISVTYNSSGFYWYATGHSNYDYLYFDYKLPVYSTITTYDNDMCFVDVSFAISAPVENLYVKDIQLPDGFWNFSLFYGSIDVSSDYDFRVEYLLPPPDYGNPVAQFKVPYASVGNYTFTIVGYKKPDYITVELNEENFTRITSYIVCNQPIEYKAIIHYPVQYLSWLFIMPYSDLIGAYIVRGDITIEGSIYQNTIYFILPEFRAYDTMYFTRQGPRLYQSIIYYTKTRVIIKIEIISNSYFDNVSTGVVKMPYFHVSGKYRAYLVNYLMQDVSSKYNFTIDMDKRTYSFSGFSVIPGTKLVFYIVIDVTPVKPYDLISVIGFVIAIGAVFFSNRIVKNPQKRKKFIIAMIIFAIVWFIAATIILSMGFKLTTGFNVYIELSYPVIYSILAIGTVIGIIILFVIALLIIRYIRIDKILR